MRFYYSNHAWKRVRQRCGWTVSEARRKLRQAERRYASGHKRPLDDYTDEVVVEGAEFRVAYTGSADTRLVLTVLVEEPISANPKDW